MFNTKSEGLTNESRKADFSFNISGDKNSTFLILFFSLLTQSGFLLLKKANVSIFLFSNFIEGINTKAGRRGQKADL